MTTIRRAVGLFDSRMEAERALTELRDDGFSMDKVSAIAQDASHNDQIAGAEVKPTEEKVKGGTKTGATAGAATGGLMGLIGGLGLLAIPGLGLAAEIGLLLGSTLLGSGFGAAGGGLIGALVGWGLPETQAKHYSDRVTQGDYLVVVEGTPEEIGHAERILSNRKIQDWYAYDVPGTHPHATTVRTVD